MSGGAIGVYHLSSVIHHGPPPQVHLFGSEGTIKYLFAEDRLLAGRGGEEMREVEIPAEKAGGWRVEADFIDAIRGKKPIEFTDFSTGVRYMSFTAAVAQSAAEGRRILLST